MMLTCQTLLQENSNTTSVSHCDLAIYIIKCLTTKEELRKLKYFHHVQIKICKNSFKRNQNPSRYYNSKTNFMFNTSQNIIFQKSSYKYRLLPRGNLGQSPLKLIYTFNTILHKVIFQ